MNETIHQYLADAASLDAWEPCDGCAIVTCKIRIRSGAYDAWEPRTYEFRRTTPGAWIPGRSHTLLLACGIVSKAVTRRTTFSMRRRSSGRHRTDVDWRSVSHAHHFEGKNNDA